MYKIDLETDEIIFPDGFRLAPPYTDPRYFEYAEWIHTGNQPELIGEKPE